MCIFTEDMISLQDYRIAIGLHALKCPSIKKMKKYTTNIKKGAFSVHNMIRLFILIVFNKFILTKGTAKLFAYGPKDIWSKKNPFQYDSKDFGVTDSHSPLLYARHLKMLLPSYVL